MSTPSKSKPWIGVIKYVVGFALLALVLWMNWNGKNGAPGLKDLLQRTPDWVMFAVTAVLAVGTIGMQYVRWYVLVRALDLPFTFRNAVRLGMVGTFYNTFLPGSVGGDFVKAYFIAQGHPTRKPAAVATVVADRLLGLFGLLLTGGLIGGLVWLGGDANLAANRTLQTLIVVCLALAGTGAVGYAAIGFLSHHQADRLASRLHRLPKVGPTLAELWFTARQYRARPRAILAGVGLSAVSHTFMMLMFHFAVRIYPPLAADFTVNESLIGTFPEHLVIAPIGFIGQALVPLPGGLGAAEFGFGRLYEMIRPGGGEVVGLTGRLALRVIEWCMGGVCYLMYLRMKAELPATEGKKEEAAVVPGVSG